MDLLIKNGTLITTGGCRQADIAVNDGKIEAIYERSGAPLLQKPDPGAPAAPPQPFETVDASGLYVLPGAIDAHTHFELPMGDLAISADDFYTGTRAAACGGVTAVIDFAAAEPGETLMEAYRKRRAVASSKACIDYGLHMSLTRAGGRTLEEMKDVAGAGATGFKVFMTYATRVTDDEFTRILSRAKDLGALIMVHAEAHEELEALRAQFIAQGKADPWHHYLSRPESVETKAVERAIELTVNTGAALYVVHLASAGGVAAVEKARRGLEKPESHPGAPSAPRIYAETCPQYLHFTSDVYKRPDGHNFVCSPPMKGEESRDALWQGIRDGTISTVATDHCPFTLAEKARGKNDFTKIPNGVMGTETLYPYMLGMANEGRVTFERVVELCCKNPAEIFGLSKSKGSLEPGKDADIVLYDPGKEVTITQANSHSAADYTIWEGTRLKGYPVSTYSRGTLIYHNGEFLGEKGRGRYLARG